MIYKSVSFDEESLEKLEKIIKSMKRNRSDTIRQIIKEYKI